MMKSNFNKEKGSWFATLVDMALREAEAANNLSK